MKQYQVGILVFNEVEVLDFSGLFEVFSITQCHCEAVKPFNVSIISQTGNLITARNGLKILPDYSIADAADFDILIIQGGYGAENIEIYNDTLIQWIKTQAYKTKILASVCTGAFLLVQAGLLDNKKATTHWMDLDRLESEYKKIIVQYSVRFVDEESIISSAGIFAGTDMCLYIVSKLLGASIAQATAKRMEYGSELY